MTSARVLRMNGPFQRMLGGHLLIQAGVWWYFGLLPFFLTYVLKLPALLLLILMTGQLVGVAATPAWSRLVQQTGRAPALATAAAVQVAGMVVLWFLPASHPALTIAAFLFLGLTSPTIVMLPYSLADDAADHIRWKTRIEATAVHMSRISLVTKCGVAMSAAALFAAGTLGFDPSHGDPSSAAISLLRALTTLVPCVFTAAGAILITTFPLTKRRQAAIRLRLLRRQQHRPGSINGVSPASRGSAIAVPANERRL